MVTVLVVVTGPPASGKTSLARTLARELGLPWIGKDALKEPLYEVIGSGDDLEPKLEEAARRLLLTVAQAQLEAGVSALRAALADLDGVTPPLDPDDLDLAG